MRHGINGKTLPIFVAVAALAVCATVGGAAAGDGHKRPHGVKSKDDSAVATKLSPDLQQQVADDSTAPVKVLVTLQSAAVPQAESLLSDTHVASRKGVALIVGTLNATKLAKVAGLKGVVGVTSIQFKQSGSPTGNDPEVGNQPDQKTRNAALAAFQKRSVPFDKAPPLKTSNFDQVKSMNVLDAKTHNFTGAWNAGFTGTGVTASVLDGGTDWGHPDLIGTWQTWTAADVTNYGADPGWVGWPKAFDPYSTLVMLAAPDLIPQGLSWYTETQSAACTYVNKNGKPTNKIDKNTLCSVTFATQTGPARNFSAPAGTNTHTYTFPASWTQSGTVKLDEPSGRVPAPAVRRAPGGARHRPEHSGPVRHRLRRPERRLQLLRREAGHEELAGLLSRPERRRLHRSLGRPPLLHLGRPHDDPGRPDRLRRHRYARRRVTSSPGPATSTRASRVTERSPPRTSSARP